MGKFKKLLRMFSDRAAFFNALSDRGFFNSWSDEKFIKYEFKVTYGREMDLKNPQTFNEKLNWMKLYYRLPLFSKMADKYEVKKLVSQKIGEKYVVPLYNVWERPEEIDFDALPEQFVLKCTHNSGAGRCVCKDKKQLDLTEVKNELNRGLKQNYFFPLREWPYKNIKPRIIAEKFLDDHTGRHELTDYKFMCFNGEPKIVYLTNKAKVIFENFYDMNFQPLDINRGFMRLSPEFEKPAEFEELKQLAKKLAEGLPFVRVDFFLVDHKIYFGEFTFYDWAGLKKFTDPKWDTLLGSWITLPQPTFVSKHNKEKKK